MCKPGLLDSPICTKWALFEYPQQEIETNGRAIHTKSFTKLQYIESKVPLDPLWRFLLLKNALVKKSWQHLLITSALPSTLLDELLMDKSSVEHIPVRSGAIYDIGFCWIVHIGTHLFNSTVFIAWLIAVIISDKLCMTMLIANTVNLEIFV